MEFSVNNTAVVFSEVSSDRFALVDYFYKAQKTKLHCGKTERVFVARVDDEIIAAVRLLPDQTADERHYFLLRNLLVAKDFRGNGIARQLMLFMLQSIEYEIFLFSLAHLVQFYQSLCFQLPQNLPEKIAQQQQIYKSRNRDWVLMVRG